MLSDDQKIEQLLQRDQELKSQIKTLFEDIELTPEELSRFLSQKENFTPEEWGVMEAKKRELKEQIERSMNSLPNPEKTASAYKLGRRRANWVRI